MTAMRANSLWSTDPDVDSLAWQFLNSEYAGARYVDWPLDRRLEGFLRYCGLARIADDGDLYNQVLDHVMTHISSPTGYPGNGGDTS
jgi:hypothetical protein